MADDPWDWTVDRIVKELCTEDRSWDPPFPSKFMSDPVQLEAIIRENEIDGFGVLTCLSDATMEELGLNKFKQKKWLTFFIMRLRKQSSQYQNMQNSINAQFPAAGAKHQIAEGSWEESHKKPRLSLEDESLGATGVNSFMEYSPDFAPDTTNDAVLHSPQQEKPAKKPKRLAPTFVRPLSPVRQSTVSPPAEAVRPGSVFIDPKTGRKRMSLVPLGEPQQLATEAHQSDASANPLVESRSTSKEDPLSKGDLGKAKIPFDKLFYGNVLRTEDGEVAAPAEFQDGTKRISSGRRISVNQVLKRFLQQDNLTHVPKFTRNGEWYSAIVPYPLRLVAIHQHRSFTLLRVSQNRDVQVSKELVSQWPELVLNDSDRSKVPDSLPTAADSNELIGLQLSSGMDLDLDALGTKYSNLDDDAVLPLYGDSGSEGEYDDDTWREMEREILENGTGSLERPLLKTNRQPLRSQEVESAIDQAIAELVEKWQIVKLPKIEDKAWQIYHKYHNRRNHRRHILQDEIAQLEEDRIPKLRKNIAEEVYTRVGQVHSRVKGNMEVTIYDRAFKQWECHLLKNKIPPVKPDVIATKAKKKGKKAMSPDEELIGSETQLDSDDDLDDFLDDVEDMAGLLADDSSDDDGFDSLDSDEERAHADRYDALVARGSKSSLGVSAEKEDEPVTEEKYELPRARSTPRSKASRGSFIDLTILSSSLSPPNTTRTHREMSLSIRSVRSDAKRLDLMTPQNEEEPSVLFKRPQTPIIISDTDTEKALPYHETAKIARVNYPVWERLRDRDRLIIKFLHNMTPSHARSELLAQFKNNEGFLWERCSNVLHGLHYEMPVPHMPKPVVDVLATVIRLFMMYFDCKFIPPFAKEHDKYSALTAQQVNDVETHQDLFPKFCETVVNFAKNARLDATDDESLSLDNTTCDDDQTDSSHVPEELAASGRKKRRVVESAEARKLRQVNTEQNRGQEQRRQTLMAKFSAVSDDPQASDLARRVINLSKHDDEELICIDEAIAKKIKDHQIAGVRFMWEQIVSGRTMQGCLLAHTMGLGKTMQVITLLVAIVRASQSPLGGVQCQIHKRFRPLKALVMCPPGLVDNWEDELLMWDAESILGNPLKITAGINIGERMKKINRWYHSTEPGVLLMGYSMFYKLFVDKPSNGDASLAPNVELATARQQLLEGPGIIIADEAHYLKNSKSIISTIASQFKSQSRIAMTGSPLPNNIEDYHAMIDWIAPNYLGPIKEFKSKYMEPIESGLYVNSSREDRKRSRKMLAVLIRDVDPKVNRANTSVLRGDLPPKKEFVLHIVLTDVQKELYTLYVRALRDPDTFAMLPRHAHGQIMQTALWSLLTTLSLLCNHPACLKQKLDGDSEAGDTDVDGEEKAAATQVNSAVSTTKQHAQMVTLLKEVGHLPHPALSNKLLILFKILDESRAEGDKVLVFTQSILTLKLLARSFKAAKRKFSVLEGQTAISGRQDMVKEFNTGNTEIFLISTKAGGIGLNLCGANRVVMFDFKYTPAEEEQAIGRAYRLGQTKPVFVYRFVVAGTFETAIQHRAVFKIQLASRVVDKTNPLAWAKRSETAQYLVDPVDVEQEDLAPFRREDNVLDKILDDAATASTIRNILKTDAFAQNDTEDLDAEDQKEVDTMARAIKTQRDKEADRDALLAGKEFAHARAIEARQARAQVQAEAYAPSEIGAVPSATSNVMGQPWTSGLRSRYPQLVDTPSPSDPTGTHNHAGPSSQIGGTRPGTLNDAGPHHDPRGQSLQIGDTRAGTSNVTASSHSWASVSGSQSPQIDGFSSGSTANATGPPQNPRVQSPRTGDVYPDSHSNDTEAFQPPASYAQNHFPGNGRSASSPATHMPRVLATRHIGPGRGIPALSSQARPATAPHPILPAPVSSEQFFALGPSDSIVSTQRALAAATDVRRSDSETLSPVHGGSADEQQVLGYGHTSSGPGWGGRFSSRASENE